MIHIGEEIVYDPSLKLLICKLHGNGLHPSDDAIKRHLRGRGHRSRGQALARVLRALSALPLSSLEDLRHVQLAKYSSNGENLRRPIRYLTVFNGWRCVPCEESFLTTSLELVQRHAAALHNRKRGEPELWEECLLQTLFSETKDRRYFRVAEQHQAEPHISEIIQDDIPKEQSSPELESPEIVSNSASPVSDVYWSGSDSSGGSASSLESTCMCSHESMSPLSQVARRSNIPQAIVLQHSFMSIAEKYVPLCKPRLNYLLKSNAFRAASMPFFDSSPTNTAINMKAVFPESEDSAVWANALLYSTVQIMNRGAPTVEGQLLQKKTIQLINGKLSFPDETLCSAAVGAIMVLKATAYKTCDLVAHEMHTKGLAKVLEYIEKTGSTLTPAARKAMFWLDLSAAAHVGSERQMSHLDLSPVIWRREIRPEIAGLLPIGFARHREAFPYGLPECIADLGEFQAHLREYRLAQIPRCNRYAQLEPMQASIESRLLFQSHACGQFGVLAEAVRLAMYICTYCSWMDTWNNSLLPCRLAIKVFECIDSMLSPSSLPEGLWLDRMDLILWLVFISSSVAELDQGEVEGIGARRNNMLNSVYRNIQFLRINNQADLKPVLLGALNDFIYVDGWLEKRNSVSSWCQLELDINRNLR